MAANDKLYHATLAKYIPSILSKGILPMQTSNWVKGSKGERYGEGEIYAFDHPNDAVRWAFKMQWEFKEKVVIVTFLKGDLEWKPDNNDPLSQLTNTGRWWKFYGRIPVENIIKVTELTPELTQKVVKGEDVKLGNKKAMITSDAELANNTHPADGNAGAPVLDGNLEAPERANVNAMREAIETQKEMEVGKPVEEKEQEIKTEEKGISVERGNGGTQIIINVAGKNKKLSFSSKEIAATFIKDASAKFGKKFKVVAAELVTLKRGDRIAWKTHQFSQGSRYGTVIDVLPENEDGLIIFDAIQEDISGHDTGHEVWGYMGLVYTINGQAVKPVNPEKAEFEVIETKRAAITSGMSDIDNGAPEFERHSSASEEPNPADYGCKILKDKTVAPGEGEFYIDNGVTLNEGFNSYQEALDYIVKNMVRDDQGSDPLRRPMGSEIPREYVIAVDDQWVTKTSEGDFRLTNSLKRAYKYDSFDNGREVKQDAVAVKNGIGLGRRVQIIPTASLPSIVAKWEDGYWKGEKKDGYPSSYFNENDKLEYPWEKEKHNVMDNEKKDKKQSAFNFSPSNVPSQVIQEFYPEIQHEIIDYPNATNAPMVNPEITGDTHELGTAPAEGIGEAVLTTNNESPAISEEELIPGAIEDAFDGLSRIGYVSTSPAGAAGIGRDGKPQVLEGAPLRKENDIRGQMFMDEFYQNYQEVPGAALNVISKKVAANEEKQQFSLFLKKVMGEVAASFIAAFKATSRMPLNKVPGVGEIQLAQIEQATNTSAFNIVNTGSRVKYLMDKLTDSQIQDAINGAYAQGAVWHEGKEGGFVYEVFVRAETIDTDSMILSYRFITGTKEANEED